MHFKMPLSTAVDKRVAGVLPNSSVASFLEHFVIWHIKCLICEDLNDSSTFKKY